MIKKILGICIALGLLTSFSVFAATNPADAHNNLPAGADSPAMQAATQAAIDAENAAEAAYDAQYNQQHTDKYLCEHRKSSYGKIGNGFYKRTGPSETEGKCDCKPSSDNCCGIQLYTNVPFVGKCIEYGGSTVSGADGSSTVVTPVNAFPVLLGAMSKILLSVILIVCFGAIVVAGVMVSYGNPEGGRKLIEHVVIAMALLGASGVILRLVNPNFFQ